MTKQISVIAAVSQNGVYSEGGKIPWHIPEDFKHFKDLTIGHTVIMGRKTWESLPPEVRPLPNRNNVVITSAKEYRVMGATVAVSVEQAILDAQTEKVFCIGGSKIWYQAMPFATEAWITLVKRDYPVTFGITQMALDLINPQCTWPGFYLRGVKRPELLEKASPHFEIYYWTR